MKDAVLLRVATDCILTQEIVETIVKVIEDYLLKEGIQSEVAYTDE